MELLRELIEVKHDQEMVELLEELGNLGKLGLGSMVDAFKQTYRAWDRGRRDYHRSSSTVGSKFSDDAGWAVGKDSETVDGGNIKNWPALKRVHKKNEADRPVGTIFDVDGKPVALLVGMNLDNAGVNDKVGLAWDFSKVAPTKEEIAKLEAGLGKAGDSSWRRDRVGGSEKLGASARTDIEKKDRWDDKKKDETVTKKYAGYVQTIREIVPFVNNLADTFGNRLTVRLILSDKVRSAKRSARSANRPIDPKELKLFKDDLKTRLAKYKNTKVDTAEDAADFVKKVFEGGMKKVKFAGRSYSAVPEVEHLGSNQERGGYKNRRYFYNGTFNSLLSGKPVTMKFEADRGEGDYNTLYLTVKFDKGSLVPVEMRYSAKDESYGKSETVKF